MDGETFLLRALREDKAFQLLKRKGLKKLLKNGLKGVTGHLFMMVTKAKEVSVIP